MTALTDPFETVHKKDIKKNGQVVAQVDYVGWAQVAERLDAAAPDWSFSVLQLGDDWAHGRLTFGGRVFENIGYAENADAEWKKEPLKDAVSDALKRCAAMAGVARYLYDKDSSQRPAQTRSNGASNGAAAKPRTVDNSMGLTSKQFFEAVEKAGIDRKRVSDVAKDLYGQWQINALTNEQRAHVLEELTDTRQGPAGLPSPAGPAAAPDNEWGGLA